jgi:hypothetical protein
MTNAELIETLRAIALDSTDAATVVRLVALINRLAKEMKR